ncbi:MAG: hypothetical protein GX593_00655 [Actinomycetales bacterium]|nr:hypothetical protein [Actinomycetales bacterium]
MTTTAHAREREARARAVLARVEQRTGARSLVAPVGTVASPVPEPEPARPVLTDLERPPLPVPPELERLLGAGLRRGATVAVLGSTSLALALLAPASVRGSWVGVVGQPSIGLVAAAQAGVVLDRVALVPEPGPDAPGVVAALLDGMDMVLVGPRSGLTDADRRRLVARARERGSVLVSTAPWPGAGLVLGVRTLGWTGAGEGDGRLLSLDVRVTRSGRGAAGAPLAVELTLPLAAPGRTPVSDGGKTAGTSTLRLVG